MKSNPLYSPQSILDFLGIDETALEENIEHFKLPSDPEGFAIWEENVFQLNLYDSPTNKVDLGGALFFPRLYWKNRIVPGMTSLDAILKSKNKNLIAGMQYQVLKDQDKIVVHFMATRPRWRRKGVMSLLVKIALESHGVHNVEFDSPTKMGTYFSQGRRTKE